MMKAVVEEHGSNEDEHDISEVSDAVPEVEDDEELEANNYEVVS